LVPVLVGAAMLAVAQADTTVVFPEAVALASGIWVFQFDGWTTSKWQLTILVPALAAAGVAIAGVGIEAWQGELVVLTAVLVVLFLLRCRLVPAISAAMIPSVFHITSWVYPLAVLAVCLALAAGLHLGVAGRTWRIPRHRPGGGRLVAPWRAPTVWSAEHLALVWLVGAVLVVGAGLAGHVPAGVVVPPMFVSLAEAVGGTWSPKAPGGSLRTLSLRWGTLVLGATLGAVVVDVLGRGWAASAVLVVVVWLMIRLLRQVNFAHVPSVALVLVPLLVPKLDLATFVAGIAVGAGFLVGAGWLAVTVQTACSHRDGDRG